MTPEIDSVELFDPSIGDSGEYGRDFRHEDAGLGRVELVPGSKPAVQIRFFDHKDWRRGLIKADSRTELIDAIDNEQVVRGIVYTGIARALSTHED